MHLDLRGIVRASVLNDAPRSIHSASYAPISRRGETDFGSGGRIASTEHHYGDLQAQSKKVVEMILPREGAQIAVMAKGTA